MNWLQAAQDAYEQSTSFVDNNYRKKWDNWLKHFRSKHEAGSKYNTAAYKYRSKFFRAKTRAAVRNNEAAAMAAFFSNLDLISIEAQNPNNLLQVASADILKEIVQYRLENSIPWFTICMGAFQTSNVTGAICSYNYWKYKERKVKYLDGTEEVETIKDTPCIELRPIENIRFHPAADWVDPVNTSPYFIDMIPMTVADVKKRMKSDDPKTNEPKWVQYDDAIIAKAMKHTSDSTRQAREDGEDKYDTPVELKDYQIVWIHRNFIQKDTNDYVFYTLGTEKMLTRPEPIEEYYFHGIRPYTLGVAQIEAFNAMPDSLVGLGSETQKEMNELANQRADNVSLVLNKRWFVKRGAQIDITSITSNLPGSVTLMNNPAEDVRGQEFSDITGSAYYEQDRLSLDFDEVVGVFSPSTVQSNRKMNETVGGMQMMRGSSNALVEYIIRTFSETWVEPTMKQLVKLEQYYESDEVVLAIAAEKAQLFERYGISIISDELLNQSLTTRTNVGMGATDPVMKLQNFMMMIESLRQVLTLIPPGTLNIQEVVKEIFSIGGQRDGARFLIRGSDPEKMALMQQLQELQKVIETKAIDAQNKTQIAGMKEDGATRRKAAEIMSNIELKKMDLQNPVPGERIQ